MVNLNKQIDFILELEKLKAVYRQNMVSVDKYRAENSAEHSWHAAMVAQVFKPYVIKEVNLERVTKMLLFHDVVEIYAGDTFAFATQDILDKQRENEINALNKLFAILPENQGNIYKNLWLEYDAVNTNDAIYANAIDCLQPFIMNVNDKGGSWRKHPSSVSKERLLQRNKYLKDIAPKLWDYLCKQIDNALVNGWILK